MNLLLLSGSFHQNSYSMDLLKAMQEMLAQEHECALPNLLELPFYSEDIAGAKMPQVVKQFIHLVGACDGIVVCSPEYNHSIPAVIKNAIDWASRPAFNSCLKHKPVTFFTQASSPVGGARAQAHFKLVFDSCLSLIYPSHEQMIFAVHSKFDENLVLTHQGTAAHIQSHLESFMAWISQTKTTHS